MDLRLVSTTICDDVLQNPAGRLTLHAIFRDLHADAYPAEVVRLHAVTTWFNGAQAAREVIERVAITAPDGELVAHPRKGLVQHLVGVLDLLRQRVVRPVPRLSRRLTEQRQVVGLLALPDGPLSCARRRQAWVRQGQLLENRVHRCLHGSTPRMPAALRPWSGQVLYC